MRILIDGSRANTLQRTGVEWYSYHLISELMRVIPSDVEVILYTRESLVADMPTLPTHWRHVIPQWPRYFMWSLVGLSFAWWKYRNDPHTIAFIPASVLPLVAPQSVVTIHDIGFVREPRAYSRWARRYLHWSTKQIVARATRIITPSAFTKNEVCEVYHADPSRITVIPNAPAVIHAVTRETTASPFFLYVGRIEHKKNVIGLVRAFEMFKRMSGSEMRLVLVGGRGNGYDEIIARINRSTYVKDIVIHGHADAATLAGLYAHATALVFYSRYEGFGIPLLEAMSAGVPIIASDIPAHREVGGDLIHYADVADSYMLAQQMNSCSSYIVDDSFVVACRTHAAQFTWRRAAESVWKLLTSIDIQT